MVTLFKVAVQILLLCSDILLVSSFPSFVSVLEEAYLSLGSVAPKLNDEGTSPLRQIVSFGSQIT